MDIFELYRTLRREKILFCYSGAVSQSILEGIGVTLRQQMELDDAGRSKVIKVFSVFVEQMQNVINYSAEGLAPGTGDGASEKVRCGIVVIGHEDGEFFVLSGNYIESREARSLERMLRTIQGMNREELRAFYKEQRRKDPPPESRGAGLGFIEIARQASLPIEFRFSDVEGGLSFFTLKAVI